MPLLRSAVPKRMVTEAQALLLQRRRASGSRCDPPLPLHRAGMQSESRAPFSLRHLRCARLSALVRQVKGLVSTEKLHIPEQADRAAAPLGDADPSPTEGLKKAGMGRKVSPAPPSEGTAASITFTPRVPSLSNEFSCFGMCQPIRPLSPHVLMPPFR